MLPTIHHTFMDDPQGYMKEGMVFTIEPILCQGEPDMFIWEEDGWTAVTVDGSLSAQAEHTILIEKQGCRILT